MLRLHIKTFPCREHSKLCAPTDYNSVSGVRSETNIVVVYMFVLCRIIPVSKRLYVCCVRVRIWLISVC